MLKNASENLKLFSEAFFTSFSLIRFLLSFFSYLTALLKYAGLRALNR